MLERGLKTRSRPSRNIERMIKAGNMLRETETFLCGVYVTRADTATREDAAGSTIQRSEGRAVSVEVER